MGPHSEYVCYINQWSITLCKCFRRIFMIFYKNLFLLFFLVLDPPLTTADELLLKFLFLSPNCTNPALRMPSPCQQTGLCECCKERVLQVGGRRTPSWQHRAPPASSYHQRSSSFHVHRRAAPSHHRLIVPIISIDVRRERLNVRPPLPRPTPPCQSGYWPCVTPLPTPPADQWTGSRGTFWVSQCKYNILTNTADTVERKGFLSTVSVLIYSNEKISLLFRQIWDL